MTLLNISTIEREMKSRGYDVDSISDDTWDDMEDDIDELENDCIAADFEKNTGVWILELTSRHHIKKVKK